MGKLDQLREMRERGIQPARAAPVKRSRGGGESRPADFAGPWSRQSTPAQLRKAGVATGPREAFPDCPRCAAQREAKRKSMAKWRAKEKAK